MFLFAGAGELVLAQDAGDGVMAARQVELVLEALGAEAGLAAQLDDLALQAAGGLVGAVLGAATGFGQGRRLAGLVATAPFAHGVAGTAELAGGGLDAVATGKGHQLLMQPMAVGPHAIEFKIGAVHPKRMADLAARCCGSSGGAAAAPLCVGCSTL